MGQETTVRRSCQFCRKRKIRCSGEADGCSACTNRSQTCLYEETAQMGRPRTLPLKTITPRKIRSPAFEQSDILNGMARLRLSSDVRTTFNHFSNDLVGTLITSFFGIVSSSGNSDGTASIPEGSSCRVFYEAAFQSIPPLEIKSARTEEASRAMATNQCWSRFPSELVSFATVGTPSDGEDGAEEPFFVRLLKEDESGPWTHSVVNDTPRLDDPVSSLDKSEILDFVTEYFLHSPFAFFLNDTLVLESIANSTYDRALISIMIAFVLFRDPLSGSSTSTASPPETTATKTGTYHTRPRHSSLPSPPEEKSSSSNLAATPFMLYAEREIFSRSAEFTATSVSTNQAIMILGVILLSQHKARASWSIMATGLSCVRESLKRAKERDQSVTRTEEQLVEDEQLINLWWMFAIFGSWSFLSMDLPRSTLIDVADSQPLPAFTFDSSRSYAYRSTRPHIATATSAIQSSIRSFNETCRTLSLVITLSIKKGPKGTLKMNEINARLPSDRREFEYPFVADPRLAGLEVWQLFVGKWLLDMAEQHSLTPPPPQRTELPFRPPNANGEVAGPTTNSFSSRKIRQSSFLSTVHAIMCLHRLAPFNEPEGKVELSAPALRIAVRAMELVVQESAELVRIAMGREGWIDPAKAKTGLLRLIGDCLPHCLRVMHFLTEQAQTSMDIRSLLGEPHFADRVASLLAELILLGNCGLRLSIIPTTESTAPLVSPIDKSLEREAKRARASKAPSPPVLPLPPPPPPPPPPVETFALWPGSQQVSYSAPSIRNPYVDLQIALPDHSPPSNLHSLPPSLDPAKTLSLPYPYSFDSQLAPDYIAQEGSNVRSGAPYARPQTNRRATSTGAVTARRDSLTSTKMLAHRGSVDSLRPRTANEERTQFRRAKADPMDDVKPSYQEYEYGLGAPLHRVNSLGRPYSDPRNLVNPASSPHYINMNRTGSLSSPGSHSSSLPKGSPLYPHHSTLPPLTISPHFTSLPPSVSPHYSHSPRTPYLDHSLALPSPLLNGQIHSASPQQLLFFTDSQLHQHQLSHAPPHARPHQPALYQSRDGAAGGAGIGEAQQMENTHLHQQQQAQILRSLQAHGQPIPGPFGGTHLFLGEPELPYYPY